MKIAIHQPNFLPWMGYFDKMAKCDIFVIFDDVQLPMGGHSYETRAIIRGPVTLTVPVHEKGHHLIKDTRLAEGRWRQKHLKSIAMSYPNSPIIEELTKVYNHGYETLSDFNVALIRLLADWLSVRPEIVLSSDLKVEGSGTEKILGIVKSLGGDTYVSGRGNGSRRYVSEEVFLNHGIRLLWHEYSGPNISAIDSLARGASHRMTSPCYSNGGLQ